MYYIIAFLIIVFVSGLFYWKANEEAPLDSGSHPFTDTIVYDRLSDLVPIASEGRRPHESHSPMTFSQRVPPCIHLRWQMYFIIHHNMSSCDAHRVTG